MQFYFRALSYFRDDLGKIIVNFVLIGVGTVLGLLWPFPLAILIDSVLGSKHSDHPVYRLFFKYTPQGDTTTQIIVLAVAMFVLRMAGEVLRFAQTLINIRIGYNGLMRVRCDLFRKLQALSLAYHKSQPQGDAIYRLSYDTSGLQGVLNVTVGTLVNGITLVAMAGIMFTMNWRLTLISLIVVPLLIVTMKWYGKILKQRYLRSFEVESQLTTVIQRSVASIGLVQAFGREQDEYASFFDKVDLNNAVKMKLHWDEVMYWLVLGTIFSVAAAVIFGYGAVLVSRGMLEVGMLTVFLFYLEKLYEPLKSLTSSGASIQGGIAQCERVFEVLDRDPIIKDSPNAVPLPKKARTLTLDHVVFEYRPGSPVLDDVSCVIKPGEMVAFVGSSGVGKTTLLNLLPRFYDPVGGAMKLDEHDARHVRVKDLRKHIALVLQESVILPTTVAENIAYGRSDATPQQIRSAAELAGASVFIDKLPHKFQEQVSESGQNLSGGQKQRISIARALVTEAPIIVMDEPTSALDPEHEALIVSTLKRLKGLRTVILVSHRLSTVSDCDQIFVMDAGKIVERGTHDQLVAMRGHYFRMAKHQMKLEDDGPQISQMTQMGA